jgi:hypothetical protein
MRPWNDEAIGMRISIRACRNSRPERDSGGGIREFDSTDQSGRTLSDAPFCRFGFPTNFQVAGVYAITLNDRLAYVGKAGGFETVPIQF